VIPSVDTNDGKDDQTPRSPIGQENHMASSKTKTHNKSSKQDRNYALTPNELKELKADAKAAKAFPNPYRNGIYSQIIAALAASGVNKWHSLSVLKDKMKTLMGDDWEAFEKRKPRNEKAAKSVDERLLLNLQVLQRVRDYGKKLLQVGAVVDLKRQGEQVMALLNTHGNVPKKMGRIAATKRKAK
jgi:hypothetical protein